MQTLFKAKIGTMLGRLLVVMVSDLAVQAILSFAAQLDPGVQT